MDDAGVYQISSDLALVQTVDFFYPPLNDPEGCGRVVAANCMSDVWAMGGRALTAMNILAYPAGRVPEEAIERMLRGASEKMVEAGVALVGGHTLEQEELVYGLSVTGVVEPDRALAAAHAEPGDVLLLTKPLGTGVYCNALEKDELPQERYQAFVNSMERLNMYAARALRQFDVGAVTDVTGFGLLGHALPVARSSGVLLRLESGRLPFLPGALEMLETYYSKGVCKSRDLVQPRTRIRESVDPRMLTVIMEAQTSGGLLATVRREQAGELLHALHEAGDTASVIIGEVLELEESDEEAGIFMEVV